MQAEQFVLCSEQHNLERGFCADGMYFGPSPNHAPPTYPLTPGGLVCCPFLGSGSVVVDSLLNATPLLVGFVLLCLT